MPRRRILEKHFSSSQETRICRNSLEGLTATHSHSGTYPDQAEEAEAL